MSSGVRVDLLYDDSTFVERELDGEKIYTCEHKTIGVFVNKKQIAKHLKLEDVSDINRIVIKVRKKNPDFGRGGIFRLEDVKTIKEELPKLEELPQEGYVYLIRDKGVGLVKIGVSTNVKLRLSSLSTMVPMGIEKILTAKTNAYKSLERKLHKTFKDKRVNGEWFSLDESDLKKAASIIEKVR